MSFWLSRLHHVRRLLGYSAREVIEMKHEYAAPVRASLLAKWFVARASSEAAPPLDPLKLQKLIYLAHSRFLHEVHVPLVVEPLLAWPHGPVVRTVYNEYCEFEGRTIDLALAADGPWAHLEQSVAHTLDETWKDFGAYSAWKLREITHAVGPYENVFVANGNVVIPNDLIAHAWPEFEVLSATHSTKRDSRVSAAVAHYAEVLKTVPKPARTATPSRLVDHLEADEASIREAESLYR